MLNAIIRFSLHNRLIVLAAAVVLTLCGVLTAGRMDVDVFPDLNAPTVVVMTEARGMAPEEVERLVTFPVETAVNGAADVRRVRSSSTAGFSVVWVEFNWGADIWRCRQTVSEKLAALAGTLPRGVGQPQMGPQSSILGELMFVTLTSDKTLQRDLRTLADRTLRPRLMATGGVAQVAVLGGDVKEYQIQLHPGRMSHYGVALSDVLAALEGMNSNVTGGTLYEYGNEYIVRGLTATTSVADISKALIRPADAARGTGPLTLAAIADVRLGDAMPRTGTASHDGKQAVFLTVTKQPQAATLDLTAQIDTTLAHAAASLPADVTVRTDVYRQSRFIESSIGNVRQALIEGAVLVVVVLLLFLMNVRTTVISLVTIPLSLLMALLALHCMGLTINTMSLGGMCIAIGSLVDDAIVDVENVFCRLRENRSLPPDERRGIKDVVFDASREVRLPILNSTLIIIATFMPVFFLTGMEGRMLRPLGIAFIVALVSSTLVALTLTPVLCSYLLGRKKQEAEPREPPVTAWLRRVYGRALQGALAHRRSVLGATAAALLLAVIAYTALGSNFLPPFNEGSFTINVSTMPGVSLEVSDSIGRMAERELMSIPEVLTVGRKTGRAELDEHALGVNVSEIEVPYELKERPKDSLVAEIRRRLATLPGVNVEVGSPISHRIDAMLSGTRAGIAIKVFGTDLNRMFRTANEIRAVAQGVEGVADLNVEQQVERPQLTIVPRRELLARYGMTMPEFSALVEVLLAGREVGEVYEGSQPYALTVRCDSLSRSTIEALARMPVVAGGQRVTLGDIANVTSTAGPNTINRESAERKIVVSCNVAGRDMRSVVDEIQSRVAASVKLPEGCRVEYGGQFESERAASRTLWATSGAALLIVLALLFVQFRDMRQSLVVMLNLPLALIGGVLTVWMCGGVLSIPAIIGFISLFGIATRNGMLLVSRYNDLRREGLPVLQSVLCGSADRLNPIAMTALTTALSLVPMVLGGDLPGNEIQSPMAKVILGGLVTSTLLNGFIVPIMYLITTRKDARM